MREEYIKQSVAAKSCCTCACINEHQSELSMRKLITLVLLALTAIFSQALEIPQGTLYFDNSKTKYSQVKFVYGRETPAESFVVSMVYYSGDLWKCEIPSSVGNMYRYTFTEAPLADGKHSKSFYNLKEEISKEMNKKRTGTTDKAILPGGVYVPSSGDNWTQGSWMPVSAAQNGYSGTLPVIHINTVNGAPIVSKETYVSAKCWVDNMGIAGLLPVGSKDAPVDLEIRGRGNYTWEKFDKKPYRLKFVLKQPVAGMAQSRRFELLAHADDELGFLRNTVGFRLSKMFQLKFTPAQKPVEVVLNGDYIGLYMLTEPVRVGKNHVDVPKQPDNITDPFEITGGWLVEADNYEETDQIRFTEGNGEPIRISYKSPEILSAAQKEYLTAQMHAIDNAFYIADKNSTEWEKYVDLDTAARYYIIQEIMDDAESYHGNCYLHRGKGYDKKWIFGPVWDFGNSFRRGTGQFIYQNPPFGQTWIGELAKFPRFQAKVAELWKWFLNTEYANLDAHIEKFMNKISTAAVCNANRWPQYGNSDLNWSRNEFKRKITEKVSWLKTQWGDGNSSVENATIAEKTVIFGIENKINVIAGGVIERVSVYDLAGRVVATSMPNSEEYSLDVNRGIYIVEVVVDGVPERRKTIVK